MFNTIDAARKIRAARNAKNMTQMALADAMGVSFQAVSNWERGNSLPDIGKLPDLCRILDLSLSELLGEEKEETKIVEKLVEEQPVTPEELASVAPLVTPEQAGKTLEQAQEEGKEPDVRTLLALAPFLDDDYLDSLADRIESPVDQELLLGLAPFLSEEALGRLAERIEVPMDRESLISLAPFLSEESLDRLAEKYEGRIDETILGLAPFLSEAALDRLAERYDGPMDETVAGLAPFLSRDGVRKLAERAMGQKNFEAVRDLGRFL